MELRPYQNECIKAVANDWKSGFKKTLIVLPTGCGKTIVFSKMTELAVKKGSRVLILAHRSELLEQAADKLFKVTGIESGLEKAESTAVGSVYNVVIGSVQTMCREKRLKAYPKDFFNLIIIDEAHHSVSDTYTKILEYFDTAYVLGVTATPDRADKRGLVEVFDNISYEYTLPEAIHSHYLSPIKVLTCPLEIDISNVGTAAGDYKANELGTALDPYLEKIADEMKRIIAEKNRKRTVVFLPLIATSQNFAAMLCKRGLKAVEVNGQSPDRAEIIEDFANGKYDVVCNAMLLTEGWDCPPVDCIVMLRPTKSRSLYAQAVGRGTRVCEGKEDLLLLDFLWMCERHELCKPASLICTSEKVADKMTETLEQCEDERMFDLEEAEQQAQKDVVEEREKSLAEQLKEMRHRKKKLVDLLQFEFSLSEQALIDYTPVMAWEMLPPTDKQLETLEKFGIDPEMVDCKGKATKVIDRLIKRSKGGYSTPKQIRFLESRGFQKVAQWTFDQASNMITRYSENGWRPPRGIKPEEYIPN